MLSTLVDSHCLNYLISFAVCSNFSYLPNDYGISLTITYNDYTLFNETISGNVYY